MSRLRGSLVAVCVVVLGGCLSTPPAGSGAASTAAPRSPSVPSQTAASAPGAPASKAPVIPDPASSTPSAPAATAPAASQAPTAAASAPQAIDLASAFDVSGYRSGDFASPTGNLLCGVTTKSVICQLPVQMSAAGRATIPRTSPQCNAQVHGDVNYFFLTSAGLVFSCAGGLMVYPVDQEWNKVAKYPTFQNGSLAFATLPYGKALKAGAYACKSETTGVTCLHHPSGKGFSLSRDGLVRIG